MSQPNVNLSPRARFQLVRNAITSHRALIEHAQFDPSTDAAMLEYQSQLAMQNKDGNSAMANGFKIQGAIEYLQTLKQLAEAGYTHTPRKDLDNLPDVGQLRKQ